MPRGGPLGSLEDHDLFVGHIDIVDAFYHFGLPLEPQEYFSLPPLTAGEVGDASSPSDRLL